MKPPQTEDGRIVEHVACAGCGYDRFGTSLDDSCPECGGRGYTRNFRWQRRLRRIASVLFVLAIVELCVAIGVRLFFAWHGVGFEDFVNPGVTDDPASMTAARFLGTFVWTANALCCGGLLLTALTLATGVLCLCIGEGRGVRISLIALLLLCTAIWLGMQQTAPLDEALAEAERREGGH